jgi:hypothetical protein
MHRGRGETASQEALKKIKASAVPEMLNTVGKKFGLV